jgi:hypothetical protein
MRHNLRDYDEAVPHLSDLDIHAGPGMLCTAVRRITTTVPCPPQLTRQGFLAGVIVQMSARAGSKQ